MGRLTSKRVCVWYVFRLVEPVNRPEKNVPSLDTVTWEKVSIYPHLGVHICISMLVHSCKVFQNQIFSLIHLDLIYGIALVNIQYMLKLSSFLFHELK